MFKPAKKDKISTHIIRQIREAILMGEIKLGDSLPPEKELVEQFGVSKHTLREALRTLEGLGLIEIRRGAGGGPIVTEVDFETTKDCLESFFHFQKVSIHDLSEVRKMIEPHLARRAAETFDSEDVEDLMHLHEQCREIYRRDQSLAGAEVEINFHVLLARKTENPVLIMILDFVNNLLAGVKHNLNLDRAFSRSVLDAHQKIVDAVQAGDGEAASKFMYDHICEVEEKLAQVKELGKPSFKKITGSQK